MSPAEALLGVQALDTEADQLRHRRATLPQRARQEDARKRLVVLDRTIAEVEAGRHEIEQAERKLEDEISGVVEKAAHADRTLYSGTISAPRELQALQDEIESLGRRQRTLEDKLLELMEQAEPVDAELESLRDERDSVDEVFVNASADVADGEAEIDVLLKDVTTRRFDAAIPVPSELLAEYDYLRDRMGGIGVARLVGNRCDGCHLTLPAMEVDRIRHLSADDVVHCEECGRLLVR